MSFEQENILKEERRKKINECIEFITENTTGVELAQCINELRHNLIYDRYAGLIDKNKKDV